MIPRVLYHAAPARLRECIAAEGLRAGEARHFDVSGGRGDDLFPYAERPVYLSFEPGRSADTIYELAGCDVWAVDARGLELVADLPGLYDAGAEIDGTGSDAAIYFDEGWAPEALREFEDAEGLILIADLLDPDHPAARAAISLTRTAAHLGPIPPQRILLSSKEPAAAR